MVGVLDKMIMVSLGHLKIWLGSFHLTSKKLMGKGKATLIKNVGNYWVDPVTKQ